VRIAMVYRSAVAHSSRISRCWLTSLTSGLMVTLFGYCNGGNYMCAEAVREDVLNATRLSFNTVILRINNNNNIIIIIIPRVNYIIKERVNSSTNGLNYWFLVYATSSSSL